MNNLDLLDRLSMSAVDTVLLMVLAFQGWSDFENPLLDYGLIREYVPCNLSLS